MLSAGPSPAGPSPAGPSPAGPSPAGPSPAGPCSAAPSPAHRGRVAAALLAALALAAPVLAGCANAGSSHPAKPGQILAVGAENEYANVIAQVGGRYVDVSAVESNPNTDPHTFEASPSVAQEVSAAKLVVQNGVGYDTYMSKIEAASPDPSRRVIDVQKLLHLPAATANPHLWYSPRTMPAVAAQLVIDLSELQPAHHAYFAANAARFDASLKPWLNALRTFKREHGGTPVATTEPVGDYMLQAAGATILTPWVLQADIMNGVDPAPQAVSAEDALFTGHRVKVFVYNQQVTDTLTQSFESVAQAHGIPVVGVYETMPYGYSYQRWMLAEVRALSLAVTKGVSTKRLG